MSTAEEKGREEIAWREFLRDGHASDIEDAMLAGAAGYERDGGTITRPVDQKPATWAEVKATQDSAPPFHFVEPLADDTVMQHVTLTTEDGAVMTGFVPAVLPDDGLAVTVSGKRCLLYLHPDDTVHLDESASGADEPLVEDAEDAENYARYVQSSRVDIKIVGYQALHRRQVYAMFISDEFAEAIRESWEHTGHGGECEQASQRYLSRLLDQLVGALHLGDAKKDALGL